MDITQEAGVKPSGNDSLFAALAAFSCSVRLESMPLEVVRQAKLTIVDTVACMVAGMEDGSAMALAEAEAQRSRLPEASALGLAERLDMQAAIRINAYMGDIFELNDLTGGHAGIAIVPTALAVSEALGRNGRELLEAIVAGIEVTSRVYSGYYSHMKSYEEVGITPPGIPSTIGAAAAVARLFHFDETRTAHTMEIAASLAGWCPAEVIFGQGGQVKPMLFGAWPGSVAVQAGLYACAGTTGPQRLLESRIGLYATLAHRCDIRALTDPGHWHLARPRRKQHACCGYIHSAVDGVVALRAQGFDVREPAMIEVRMPEYIIPGVSKDHLPQAPTEARFHAEYCLALTLSGEDTIRPEHSTLYAEYLPGMQAIMARIRIEPDATLTHYHQSIVRGLDAAGRELFSRKVLSPKGAPDNPMNDRDVQGKFRTLVARRMPSNRADTFLSSLDALEDASDCGWIVRSFL